MASTIREEELYLQKLPYSMEAEQSVLGAILIDSSCIARVLELLKPEYFYRQQHADIFAAMSRMFTVSAPIDIVTVLDEISKDGVFDNEADAKVYLAQLVEMVPSTANVEAYARIIVERYSARALLAATDEIAQNCRDGQSDAATLLDFAEQKIFDIRQGRETKGLVRIDQILFDTYDTLQRLNSEEGKEYLGLSSGFSALDNITTGLNRTDLILLAARPAMGKTSFALNIASDVAVRQNKKVVVFSLEMSKEQLVSRMLSSQAMVHGTLLRTGKLTSDDWVKLAMATQILSKAPIYIDDTPGITIGQMKAKLRRVKDVGLVVIDYLQLMSSGRRIDNRVQEVSEITRGLKILAKELNVPVITLSQLSRSTEARSDHRPMLSDLRESGSIEQDADLVLFLYRDAYYNPENGEENTAECIVAKNRHGETDSVKLGWDGEHTRFLSLELFRDEN